jgi:predicted Zn-dependent protease
MPKTKKKAVRSGKRFINAGKRLKKLRSKVKLSAKSYDTLAKREAAIQRAGGSKTSTKKGMARKSARKAYSGKTGVVSKRMSNGKMSYWRISAAGKKKRISKEAYKKAKK